jgi:hypothetical protein
MFCAGVHFAWNERMATHLIAGSHLSLLKAKVKIRELQQGLCESAYSASDTEEIV